MIRIAAMGGGLLLAAGGLAWAETCPGNPDAIGTSRVAIINPVDLPRVGTLNHGRMLPLAPGEVVLTFDDGPRSPSTQSVLETLAKNCVKATFFMIGRNAKAEPNVAKLVLAAGHTIGTHTENHPLRTMTPARALSEIDIGIATVGAALGDPHAIAPFFRFPGLHHTAHAEQYLRRRAISAWSVDVDSHDWKKITTEHVVNNVMTRLAPKGRGIILLHDVQPKTAEMLPTLLAELKRNGYRIVHVVPPSQPMPAPADMIAMSEPVPPAAAKPAPALAIAKTMKLRPAIDAVRRPVHPAATRPAPHAKSARTAKADVAPPHRRAIYR